MQQVAGQAEVLEGTRVWRPFAGQTALSTALRTGTGRVVLTGKGGRVIVGSASRLRVYSEETDFQDGQFFMDGAVGAFALGSHVVLENGGRARVDIAASGSRVAVLVGSLRLSSGSKTATLSAGQQINLKTGQISAFKETDPWYDAQFAGTGAATVEAVRGPVSVRAGSQPAQDAKIGLSLDENAVLSTGSAAWAEVGFTGGGYLRLTEQSELRVLAIEKTSRGREVLLQLTKGSAWNVVQKGQGGYKLSTPVVSTAVRGTKFRVDAAGLVKVMEGQVAVPSSDDAAVSAGEQKPLGQALQALQLDDLDRFNIAQDSARARPMTLTVSGAAGWVSQMQLAAKTLPDTVVSAALVGPQDQALPLTTEGQTATGEYRLAAAPNLPEGRYGLKVEATRYGKTLAWQGQFTLDRTPPKVTFLKAEESGQLLFITGQASDASKRLTVTVTTQGGQRVTHTSGEIRVLMPKPKAGQVQIQVQDEAGNQTNVTLP